MKKYYVRLILFLAIFILIISASTSVVQDKFQENIARNRGVTQVSYEHPFKAKKPYQTDIEYKAVSLNGDTIRFKSDNTNWGNMSYRGEWVIINKLSLSQRFRLYKAVVLG